MQKTKYIFDGTNKDQDWLCRYTQTKPWNETKLSMLVIYMYIKESVYAFIDSRQSWCHVVNVHTCLKNCLVLYIVMAYVPA